MRVFHCNNGRRTPLNVTFVSTLPVCLIYLNRKYYYYYYDNSRITRLALHKYHEWTHEKGASKIFVDRLKARDFFEDAELNFSLIMNITWRNIWLVSHGLRYASDGHLYTRTPYNNTSGALFLWSAQRRRFFKISFFFLFQLKAHNMLNTLLYHQLRPTCFDVCYTIFRETTALFAQELYAF